MRPVGFECHPRPEIGGERRSLACHSGSENLMVSDWLVTNLKKGNVPPINRGHSARVDPIVTVEAAV